MNHKFKIYKIAPFDTFCTAAKLFPQAASVGLDRLNRVKAADTLKLFKRIPGRYISSIGIEVENINLLSVLPCRWHPNKRRSLSLSN
ncbi:MAG: hypothetical protein AAFV28_14100 [Cyanobacteria bacterium J06635_13]